MSGEYTYYSEGFFGFGPLGTFRPFGLMHLAPILLCGVLLILVWRKREWFRGWKNELHFRFVLSFIMFLTEFSYHVWLLYVGDISGNYLMMSKLPINVCDMGMIVCMFMVPSGNRTLFGINFFATLFGATLACIIPQTVLGNMSPSYFRYYQFFFEHLLPIFCTIYMMIVHQMLPRYRDIWITSGILGLMAIAAVRLNEAYPGADYLFLRLDVSFFPSDQYLRAALYTVAIIAVFHLMWLLQRRLLRGREE